MESRYSTFDSGKGSPHGTDAYPVERGTFAPSAASSGAAASGAAARLLAPDDCPLTAEDCAIGEVVAGKYLIEGVIGRGSMGVVVRATHLGFDELVAVKFIRPEMRQLDGIVSRFAREAKASVRIRNEHAVNVLDVGVAEPLGPFFVMEYLEGINLEELVDSQGPFDAPTAVRYVLEACEALAAAHAQGIIHRDIKPQNMFLAWQGRLEVIKLLDFGISKAALSGQIFGDDLSIGEKDWVMGTPLYMSPEQLRHAPDVDERTDIWSLGAVLYELLCGQPLFSGDTQTAVCRQVLDVNGGRPVRVAVEGVPEGLWDVIERCLSQDKERRYASVAELGQALLPFAPAGACLHVERARALLGLRPLDFFGGDSDVEASDIEDIEDIDVEPLDDTDAGASAALTALGSRAEAGARAGTRRAEGGLAQTRRHTGGGGPAVPETPPERRTYWVELAVPALACAVGFIGLHQWQLTRDTVALRTEHLQSEVLALRARPECPAPVAAAVPAPAPAASNGASPGAARPAGEARLDEPVVEKAAGLDGDGASGRGEGAPAGGAAPNEVGATSDRAPAVGTPASTESAASTAAAAPPRPSNGVRSVSARPRVAIGAPSGAAAQGSMTPSSSPPGEATSAAREARRDADLRAATAAPAQAPSAAAGSDPRAAAARRPLKPRTEPRLEFRLIDEAPAGFELVPDAKRRAGLRPAP